MNDAALHGLIESRDQSPDLFDVRFPLAPNFLLERSQSRAHTPVLAGTGKRLSRAFGS
jgi:hypothetical protein